MERTEAGLHRQGENSFGSLAALLLPMHGFPALLPMSDQQEHLLNKKGLLDLFVKLGKGKLGRKQRRNEKYGWQLEKGKEPGLRPSQVQEQDRKGCGLG